jgi:hypothetical protein
MKGSEVGLDRAVIVHDLAVAERHAAYLLGEVAAHGQLLVFVVVSADLSDGMHHRRHEDTVRCQYARDLRERSIEIRDVLQNVDACDECRTAVGDRKRADVCHRVRAAWVGFLCLSDQSRRRVEPDHLVSASAQIAREASFTATNVERKATRRRQELDKGRRMRFPAYVSVPDMVCP